MSMPNQKIYIHITGDIKLHTIELKEEQNIKKN